MLLLLNRSLTARLLALLGILTVSYSFSWLLLSNVPGDIILQWPWGTTITDQTFVYLFLALSRILCTFLAGAFLVASFTEKELLAELFRCKVPISFIVFITLALNSMAHVVEDFKDVYQKLKYRNTKRRVNRLLSVAYVLRTVLVTHLRKIAITSYAFKTRGLKNDAR